MLNPWFFFIPESESPFKDKSKSIIIIEPFAEMRGKHKHLMLLRILRNCSHFDLIVIIYLC